LLAIIVNVDSLQLFAHFNQDAAARTVMLNYYEQNEARLNEYANSTGNEQTADELREEIKVYKNEMQELAKAAALPVGWDYSVFNPESKQDRNILLTILGALVSGFAACFGAPFW